MTDSAIKYLTDFSLNQGASDRALACLETLTPTELPNNYVDFLREANGGEGFIGKEYLILWRIEELELFNREYEVERYAPGIFLFGSNGSGEAFGFDTRSVPYKVVQVPFIGMDIKYATPVANGFIDLLKRMSESDGSLL